MEVTTIKCDRCGKTYGLDELPTIEFRGVSPVKVILKAIEREDESLSADDIDLCVNCRISFREWFSARAGEGVVR